VSVPTATTSAPILWRSVLPIFVLQVALFALYTAFWLVPSATAGADTTFEFRVFYASPFVFAVALALGVWRQWSLRGGFASVTALFGNVLMLVCLLGSVGWLALLAVVDASF